MLSRADHLRRAFGLLLIAILLSACAADHPQTTFNVVSAYGEAENRVFHNTFWWTMGILAVVEVLIVYIIFRFRERPNTPPPQQIHGNTRLEVLWTTIPAIIVVFLAVPAIRTVFAIDAPPGSGALTVEVIGHQWWWEFRYPDSGVVTANQLHLPVGRQVHLELHSADVIHSFWVPRIGGKRDVNPWPAGPGGQHRRTNHMVFTVDEPGFYTGQCAEFCGDSHALMRIAVVAQSPADFQQWLQTMKDTATAAPSAQAQPAPPPAPAAPLSPADSLIAEGKQVLTTHLCVACHTIANTTAKGTLGPNLTRFATRPWVGAGALPNTPDNIARWIEDPGAVKAGAKMPGTKVGAAGMPPTGLTDDQVRAVAAYLSSLK